MTDEVVCGAIGSPARLGSPRRLAARQRRWRRELQHPDCPVDCIHPTPDEAGFDTAEQLYIDPRSCTNCEACVTACPVEAIFGAARMPPRYADYVEINAQHFEGRDLG